MHHFTFSALCAIVVVLLSGSLLNRVDAWGPDGHRAVAALATNYLSPSAKAAVDSILQAGNFESLISVSTWPDMIRSKRPETAPLHYVNPDNNDPTASPKKCGLVWPGDCSDAKCVISAIAQYTAVVADKTADATARAEALAFLTHFVGDIAQPLHNNGFLRGSNDFDVQFNGKKTNLHSVWDGAMIQKHIKDNFSTWDAWVQSLLQLTPSQISTKATSTIEQERRRKPKPTSQPTPTSVPSDPAPQPPTKDIALTNCVSSADPKDQTAMGKCAAAWSSESNALVCNKVYVNLQEGMETSGDYYENVKDLIDTQLVKAGLRLAAVLNRVFGGGQQ